MKSEFRPGRGPDGERRVIPPLPTASPGFGRTVPTISEESSPRMSLVEESSSSRETLPKDDGVATFESTSAPPLPSADPSAAPPPSSSLDSSLPNSRLPEPDPEPDSDYPISVYLQVGRDVKKAQLDEPPTIAALRVLFIERFQYNPGHADFPSIYIRDPLVGVQYELEDLSEVRNLSVLSLNIDSEFYFRVANLMSKLTRSMFSSRRAGQAPHRPRPLDPRARHQGAPIDRRRHASSFRPRPQPFRPCSPNLPSPLLSL